MWEWHHLGWFYIGGLVGAFIIAFIQGSVMRQRETEAYWRGWRKGAEHGATLVGEEFSPSADRNRPPPSSGTPLVGVKEGK